MATTKLNNGQLPTTLSSKTIDNTNDINTTTTRLKITGGSNGQVLSTDGSGNLSWATAGGGLGAPIAVVTKTADESVTSSTTLQDDDELFYALQTGKTYYIEIQGMTSRINTANTNSMFVAISGNSDGYWTYIGQNNIGLADGSSTFNVRSLNGNAGVPMPIKLFLTLKTTSATTVRLRFAQGTNNTTSVTLHKGSRMVIWEVA